MTTENNDPELAESSEDTEKEPQVFAVSQEVNPVKFTRRDFLQLAATAAASVTGAGHLSLGLAAEEPAPVAECTVKSPTLNLRKGPGTGYHVIQTLTQSDVLKVIGRNPDQTWLKVTTSSDDKGWVAASHVDCNGPVDTAPVVASTPPAVHGKPRSKPKGKKRIKYTVGGRTFSLPCGSRIPAGAVCTCNCVAAPVRHCTCDTVVTSHYWYPN